MDYNTLILTKNRCYTSQVGVVNNKPLGIVVHSTGANNPRISRYVQPDDGRIGPHKYSNHWNTEESSVCLHGIVGKDKDGNVCTYQLLPLNICAWGCGKGSKGSYNYDPMYLQFEICEDALDDVIYYNKAMTEAKELCARWCKEFDIPIEKIVSHKEARVQGYASNHGDPDHWLKKFGHTMNDFRADVAKLLTKLKEQEKEAQREAEEEAKRKAEEEEARKRAEEEAKKKAEETKKEETEQEEQQKVEDKKDTQDNTNPTEYLKDTEETKGFFRMLLNSIIDFIMKFFKKDSN